MDVLVSWNSKLENQSKVALFTIMVSVKTPLQTSMLMCQQVCSMSEVQQCQLMCCIKPVLAQYPGLAVTAVHVWLAVTAVHVWLAVTAVHVGLAVTAVLVGLAVTEQLYA
jgi:hypothetical protein